MSPTDTVLTCPKCHASMRTYERSGIHLDQCTECRGIFLDRGELDRLLDLETAVGPTSPSSTGRATHHDDRYGSGNRGTDYRATDYRGHSRKRRGILGDLFD